MRLMCAVSSQKINDIDIIYSAPWAVEIQLIVAQWHHTATEIWVKIDSGNGLLPDEPSHYLNQCRLIISEVPWQSHWGHFTRDATTIIHKNQFKMAYLKFHSNFLGANELSYSPLISLIIVFDMSFYSGNYLSMILAKAFSRFAANLLIYSPGYKEKSEPCVHTQKVADRPREL